MIIYIRIDAGIYKNIVCIVLFYEKRRKHPIILS